MTSTPAAHPSAQNHVTLSDSQAKLMQRAAWGLLHVQYEAWGVNVVRSYSREVDVRLTGIKGERRGAARKDSVEKLIRDGLLSRGTGVQVRPTPAGRAALDAFNGVAPAAAESVEVSGVQDTTPETPAEVPAAPVDESPEAAIRRHGEESAAALVELRTAVEAAKAEHSWATDALEEAEEASTAQDAARHAETADSCVEDSAKALKEAKKFRTRVRAARKAIDTLISGDSSETAEEIRATASANEADAEELYGKAEDAADACKDLAESAWNHADETCMTCGFFQCACRETMSAVLNRFGAPVVDAQAVALGYMHLSDDPEIVAEGQRAIATGYDVPLFSLDVVEDVEEEAVCAPLVPAYDSPEHTTDVRAVEGGYVPACACGWVQDAKPMQEEEWARGRAASHRDSPFFDMGRDREPNPAASVVLLPEGIPGVMSRYTRVLELHGDTAVVATNSTGGNRRVAVADVTPVEMPHLYLPGDRPYLGAAWVGVDHMPNPFHVVTYGGRRVRVSDLTPAEDMPEVTTEELGDGWERRTVLGETYQAIRLPDDVTAARRDRVNINVAGLILDASGEVVGRTHNMPDTDDIYWSAAHPGVLGRNVAGYVSIGAPRRITDVMPLTDEERAFIATGPQPTAAEVAGTRPKAAPGKGAAKVGDIEFSGEKGREVAVLLGHRYRVGMLAARYFVTHIASGEEIVTAEEKRPAMKRAVLADAVARGAAEPVAEQQAEPVVETAVEHLPRPLRLALEREALADLMEDEEDAHDPFEEVPEVPASLRAEHSAAVERFPELARWLEAPREGDLPRVVNHFCGPGGACVALRQGLLAPVDMLCVDRSGDCVKTQRAAGCWAIQADVTSLSPADPVFRHTTGAIITAPCTDFTDVGKRWGRLPENVDLLQEMWDAARHAAGRIPMGGMGDHPDFGKRVEMCLPSGRTWEEIRAEVEEAYEGNDGHLMLEVAVWVNGLLAAGAPLQWVAVEQSGKLPEELRGEMVADFQLAGWSMADCEIRDAADYGSPSHRVRTLLVARREPTEVTMDAPGYRTGLAEGTGLPEGTVFITRGERKTSGGNLITVTDQPGQSPTSRARSWDMDVKGGRMAVEHMAAWVTMPTDHPLYGSRTSVFQQLADVFMPVAGIALLGVALGVEWRPALGRYLAAQYPAVHGQAEPADPADTEPVAVFIASARSNPTRRRVLWGIGRADAMRLCSDERTAGRGHMLCWTAPEHLGVLGDDWEWTKDRGTTAAVIAELGVNILPRTVLEQAAEEISDQVPAGESVTDSSLADTEEIAEEVEPECDHSGYTWLRIDTTEKDGRCVSIGCACGAQRLARKGRSRKTAAMLAECEQCVISGEWEQVSPTLERVAVEWRPRRDVPTMRETLERAYPDGWEPITATADPEFDDEPEELQPHVQGLAPVSREQRRAAWRLAAGETAPEPKVTVLGTGGGIIVTPADTFVPVGELEPAPVLPSVGRAFWEVGTRVIHQGRHGRVTGVDNRYRTLVLLDGAEPGHLEHLEPRDLVAEQPEGLWVEGTEPQPEPRGWFAAKTAPGEVSEEYGDVIDYAAISRTSLPPVAEAEEHQEQEEPQLDQDAPALTWAEVSAGLDELWALLDAEREELGDAAPSARTFEQVMEEIRLERAGVAGPEVVPVPIRTGVPVRLRRDLMSLAASTALVTVLGASVAEVVSPRV